MISLEALTEQVLAAVLVYGYPALGLGLLLGAIGVPVPSGLFAAAAGALVAQGFLGLEETVVVALCCLIAGDLLGYVIGWWAGQELVQRHGRWVGLTQSVWERATALFERWGGVSLLLTRSLVSALSTPVTLLAGASRYRMRWFLPYDAAGRALWTAIYVGVGYAFNESVEEAAAFLGDLSGLVGSLTVAAVIAVLLFRQGRKRWGSAAEPPG